jgi:hypothetical protein
VARALRRSHLILDDVLPESDFREVHRRRVVASTADLFAAVEAVTPAELPLFRLLIRLRSVGLRTLGRSLGEPLFAQLQAQGFVLLGRDAPRELVLGLVGTLWRIRGGLRSVGDLAAFRAFGEPATVKVATNIAVEDGLVATETRVLASDAEARRRFRAYWLVVRPWSGAVRREWLRAIERRAVSG